MTWKVSLVRLSLVITLKGCKKVVYVNFMFNTLEDFLHTVVRGDGSNTLPRWKVTVNISGHKRVWVSKRKHQDICSFGAFKDISNKCWAPSCRALPCPESRFKAYPYNQPITGGEQRRTRGRNLLITPVRKGIITDSKALKGKRRKIRRGYENP